MMCWSWVAEVAPPLPTGMIGLGDSARSLWQRLAALAEPERAALAVTAHQDALIVAGKHSLLPWVEGARYLAPRTEAPALWLPTSERPDLPLELIAAAILRQHAQRPLLLWPLPSQLIPLHRLLPASDAVLQRIRVLWDR